MSETRTLDPNEYLMRENEESSEMFLLQSGTLAVLKRQGNIEKQIGTIYSGELVGEMSFLDRSPRSATVMAITEAKLTVIPIVKFEKYFSEQPAWYKALVNTLLERLRKANNKIRV
ncbi:MAG: cyclic nucleotide-binding domain-containing protein [Bacteriovoracaceae bacterium]|jgi:CRP/FNR family transcriptional regulator, cyclic AMP receptor protein|nr:cyclic nucleotide-binding domain-containing protein [Bacteriovoracaceae bacterium]